ncbi:MAG: glycosyltransferase [Lachnospiraceae bacterium]
MKKVLVGFIMNGKAGGIDKYLLNLLESVSSDNLQIDFLTNQIDASLKERLDTYGSQLYSIATLKHPWKQYRQVKKILHDGQYDVSYLNISTAIDCIAALAAKSSHISKRIIHSHSSGNDCESNIKRKVFDMLHHLCKTVLYRTATHCYGCSQKAGLWLFPRKIVNSTKFQVVYNAVDKELFRFDSQIREEVRTELELGDRLVLGHIGNFCYQKNHVFLLQVFQEVLNLDSDAILLLVGTGVQYQAICQLATQMGIWKHIRFLGWRSDTARLYQGMDIFVLPSRFEGLGMVGIEAQYAHLKCVFSDRVPEEVQITDRCSFMSLMQEPKEWAKKIIEEQEYQREECTYLPREIHYDLKCQTDTLRQLL